MSATSPRHCSKASLITEPWLDLSRPGQPLADSLLLFYAQAVTRPEVLFTTLLQEIPWQQGQVTLYGKRHFIPRLQAWHGDEGISYRYSGETLQPHFWTPTLLQLRDELSSLTGTPLNSVLCNLYRNGRDSMGWHSDDEAELGPAPQILSLSLGAVRDFTLRRRGHSRQDIVLPLPSGSLLDMRPGMQSLWQHAVPRRMREEGARINLTFRYIVSREQ